MSSYLLNSFRDDLEIRWDITSEDTGFECFYVTTNVRFG